MNSIVDDIYEEQSLISEDDINRKELLWNSNLEEILENWKLECIQLSKLHHVRSKWNKCRYVTFSIPSILIPMCISGLSGIIHQESFSTVVLMLCSSIFSGLNTFFNFGKKETLHNEFSNKFLELSDDINVEVKKPKKNRIAADVFLERIKQEYHKLLSSSPML
jgi:hypothetical protein